MVSVTRTPHGFKVRGAGYSFTYDRSEPLYAELRFSNGIGARLFIASSATRMVRLTSVRVSADILFRAVKPPQ